VINRRLLFIAVTLAFACSLLAGPVLARNYHVSGGIQYVSQGDKEKAKQNYEDAQRLYRKAVIQLTQGIEESPKDLEAWDYLGRAYGELDIADSSGWAFGTGIRLIQEQDGKEKLVKRMQDNRQFYWANYFSAAIETYRMGQDMDDEQAVKDSSLAAANTMRKAIAMMREDPRAYCNIAVFLVGADRFNEALAAVNEGLVFAPQDSCLLGRLESLTLSMGEQAAQSGDYAMAIETYEKLMADNPDDVNNAQRLGELYFQQGGALSTKAGEAGDDSTRAMLEQERQVAYGNAAKYFGMYFEKNQEDVNGRYNYGLALIRAGQFNDAIQVLQGGLVQEPSSGDFHSLMATAYTGAGNDDKATAHRLIAMVINEGTVVEDPAAFADASAKKWGAKTDAPKYLKDPGPPEEVRTLVRGEYETETWFWWSKMMAVTMVKGRKVTELDFSTVAVADTPAETGTP
jgi:tetratricopeptide (TPR) repeat protein